MIETLKQYGFICARMDRGVWKHNSKKLIAYVTFFEPSYRAGEDGNTSICIDVNGKMSRVVSNKESLKSLLKEIDRKEKLNKLFD